MPKLRDWQNWEEEDSFSRSKKRKPAGYDDEVEVPKPDKKSRRREKSELSLPDDLPDLAPTPSTPAPPPPPPPDPSNVRVKRRQMGALLTSRPAPQPVQELTPLQLARAYERSGNSPRQIYRLIQEGTPIPRLANALGLAPEQVQDIYNHEQALRRATGPGQQALRLHESGLSFAQIGEKLKVSEAEARHMYARGHVARYGADPAKQYGLKEGQPFPAGIFEQPTFVSDANRLSPAIGNIIGSLREQLGPHGYQVETTFEADALGGRHVVRVVKGQETIGQPFRLTATPNGVLLVSKTGRSPGGYRLTQQGQGTGLAQRLGQAALQMAANHQARQVGQAARPDDDDTPDTSPFGDFQGSPDWLSDDYFDEGDSTPDFDHAPPPPPIWDDDAFVPASQEPAGPPAGDARGPRNVVDFLDVNAKRNPRTKGQWRQISAGDFMRLSHAGRFREEHAESLVKDQYGQWSYPEGLVEGGYLPATAPYLRPDEAVEPLTPIVSKGSVYPLEARNYIAGNIYGQETSPGGVDIEYQWGSQKGMGKQVKRDELSLTRKYWQAGPALGVAYEQTPQHIVGQQATEPEMAYTARAFILDRGGLIPEGQMWKDVNYAPWTFGSFEQTPEKYELRFDPHYSEQEVLKAAGLLGPEGKFSPRLLKPGDRVASPSGFKKDLLRNNEAGVITGYEMVDSLNEQGEAIKALRFKGYFGNRPNVVSAMKLEGWKNLAQDKHVRERLGIDADIITNKPSDPVVANIGSLNAMPRSDFEALWREVHGDTPAPTRTSSMADVEALAKVWQRLQEKNRATEILRGQIVDADTRDNYLKAGIVKDNQYEELPPLFEGAEPMYKMDLIATGYYAPVRTNFITDVTNLRGGHLSNEILRSVEHNFPGLGEHLRELGYQGRDIYHTLFEMHQLNTKPGFTEAGSPVVNLLADLEGNPEARAGMEALYEQRLADILPESMHGLDPSRFDKAQQKAYTKFKGEAGAQAIRQYYAEALGTDSYIFRLGDGEKASYLVNPGLVERFGYIDEKTNERVSKLKAEGDYQLRSIWEAVQSGQPGRVANTLRNLPRRMEPVIKNQEELLQSAGARKKWFGTSDASIFTHVHASDYALPRNAMAMGWADLFRMTGLKRSKLNREYLNKLSHAGELLFSGLRNPASDPIAQTGTILNMLTPDILTGAGLDISTSGHPALFHPHHVQEQGGDNDSDESQIYMVLKQMVGGAGGTQSVTNAFGLAPSDPALITTRAQRHAAGEYEDALEKMKVSEAKARQNLLGFDPARAKIELVGSRFTPSEWSGQTLQEYLDNARQIGQAYNYPIRVGLNMASNPAAKALISEYGGWLYQNPLDKVNYAPGSPEDDLFSFFTSFNAFTGAFSPSQRNEDGSGIYYSFRRSAGFQNRGQFGAAGLLAILKRLTEAREGTQAHMTRQQMAAFMTRSGGNLDASANFLSKWGLPGWEQLNSTAIKGLQVSEGQQRMLQSFAEGDSPLAQMMRGYAVRAGLKSTARMQYKLQETMQDPDLLAETDTAKFRGELREIVNVMQNDMYDYGRGSGSAEFKADYKKFLDIFERKSGDNWFKALDPGSKKGKTAPGEFYSWPVEKRQKFYQLVGRLLQKHVTGYGRDEAGRWTNLDPSVARNNPLFKPWFSDYDRIRDMMAVNAREQEDDDIEGYAPTLAELAQSEVTGPLVREKYNRKEKLLGGLSQLFETYRHISGQNGSTAPDEDFENFVIGKLPYTHQEQEMFHQAELGHQEAHRWRFERFKREAGYRDDEPLYFAQGGVLDQSTRLGQTREGRDIVAGEAGREYVVPEGKTRDLGNGVKLFDEDELGRGAPAFGTQSEGTTELAKGGILDYKAYATAPQSSFEDAIRQVAYELSGGSFRAEGPLAESGVEAAKDIVRQQIETDIQRLAANGPQGGQPGLMASSLSGRATEMMALALGPNPAAADFSAWNELLSEYGLSADLQPLGVNPQQIAPGIKQQLQAQAGGDKEAYKTALAGYMQNLNRELVGKSFSHANYGNVYNAIPGWQEYWNGNRPASTIPAVALSEVAQGNLSRLVGGAGSGGGGQPPLVAQAAGEPARKEITAYAQPFSPQTVEQYRTLSEKLHQYTGIIEELNLSGATLAEVSGETAQVIKAAGKTYHRLEGQYSRAQRVLRYDELQGKMDDFMYREGEPLSEEESQELTGLQEQMVKPTGADVAAAGKVKGFIQDIFPIYAEREAAGRRGTRLPSHMIAGSPLSWAAQIAGRDPGLVKEARTTERQGLRLGQLGQKLDDLTDWYTALDEGKGNAFVTPLPGVLGTTGGIREMGEEVRDLSNLRQRRYEEAVPLKRQYDEALGRGDYQTAQGLFDRLTPLADEIGELKDQIGTLTPHVKEHVDALKIQTSSIREEIKERKALYSALGGQAGELRKQAITEADAPTGQAKLSQADAIEGQMGGMRAEIKARAKVLGQLEQEKQTLTDLIHEPQGRAITGLGKRPQTYGQMAWAELTAGYSPQRLFWEFQNIQQMQYMAFMPMLQMRQQYLGEQAALGQASYALGAGEMPPSVLSALAAQANMSRASSTFGRGVDNSMAMHAWKGLTSFLGQNEGAGSFLGAAGFDLTSGLTALMGAKMLGGPALSALGKLAGSLGVQSAPYYLPAGGPGLGATTMAALGSGGGLAAGALGVGLGLGGYEWLARPLAQSMGRSAPALSQFATVAAYGMGGYGHSGWDSAWNNWLTRAVADKSGLADLMGWQVWDQERAENFGQGVGKYTGAVTDPVPVWITKIESEAAKQLGVSSDQLPFDRTELAQMVQMAAEDQGFSKKQLEETPGVAEKLAAEIADSFTSGVSMSQRSNLRQKAIDVSGYAPGTEGSRMMSEWVQQGSQFERQQRLQAAAMVQNVAEQLDFSPQQRQEMSQKVYDLLSSGLSQTQVAHSMQQRSMSNQFYWSQAAYASGHPEMTMMDQDRPWLPKNQLAQWAIEDRRRQEDHARELGTRQTTFYSHGQTPQGGAAHGSGGFGIVAESWSGGRQETELAWQRQKLDLEQEFWDFRRKSQTNDFAMQQKLFDFNIRQQRQATEWEEKQSSAQSAYYEKQYALNEKIFELQTKWQHQDFDKQEARLDIGRSWQLEDSAWNRESFQIQSGWQMEDLQRALRYASNGRERMDIRRQIERQSILNERKETEFDREDARATVKYDWAKEDLAENRQRFEEMNELQRQQMELGREYWLQQKSMAEEYRGVRKAMMEEQIALQQEQNALNAAQFQESMRLADEQHALEREINETKQGWALQDLATARERAKEDEIILGWQRQISQAGQIYAYYQAMGYDKAKAAVPELEKMVVAAGKLADEAERYSGAIKEAAQQSTPEAWWQGIPSPTNPAGPTQMPYVGAPIMKGFVGGGYTGDGDESDVAGIVHRGDAKRVVPSQGALVIREPEHSDHNTYGVEVVTLLTAILAQLQEGGGTILIDAERLKKAGFLHASNFSQVYR